MKLFRWIFYSVVLCAPVPAYADAQNVLSLAGPCIHLRSAGACTNYPTRECFWDYDDERCESYGSESFCDRLGQQDCFQNSSCFWDAADERCERRF